MRIKRWTRVAGCLWLVLLMALPSGIVCAADAELNELAPMVKAGEVWKNEQPQTSES